MASEDIEKNTKEDSSKERSKDQGIVKCGWSAAASANLDRNDWTSWGYATPA